MQINIEKRHLYIIAALFILMAGTLVIAWNPGGNANPSVMGHSYNEIYGVPGTCNALNTCASARANGWNLNQTVLGAESATYAVSAGYATSAGSLSGGLTCTTVENTGGTTANCPSGYSVTGCGTYTSGEADKIQGNGCYNQEIGVWARCCK